MAEYLNVEDARKLSGLRVVLSPSVPGPWSEAAKGILYVKKIPYVRVRQDIGGENRALVVGFREQPLQQVACHGENLSAAGIEFHFAGLANQTKLTL